MPTPAQSAKVMLFNRGNKTGKHYTKTEIDFLVSVATASASSETLVSWAGSFRMPIVIINPEFVSG